MPAKPSSRPARRPAVKGATADRILDLGEHFIQTRGFNAFSYADVAAKIGIRTPSLHHHFKTKAALGVAIIARYVARFHAARDGIDAAAPAAPERLRRYTTLFAGVLARKRMCLCGVLAAEYKTLPPPMQKSIRAFLADNERWLTEVIAEGRAAGTLLPAGTDREVARLLLGGLEGGMLVAQPTRDTAGFEATARLLVNGLLRPA